MMGVFLIPAEKGMQIDKMVSDGAAAKAGLKKNDLIEKLDGVSVQSMSDIRIALLDKSPGDYVKVSVLRKRLVAQDQRIEVQLELGE